MLKDKVAVVAAFSRGLGFEITREFAQRGARAIVCSRIRVDVEKSVTLIKGDTCPEKPNVINPHAIAEFVLQVTVRHRLIDVLVINAGHILDRNICNRSFHEVAEEDFERVIDVWLKGTVRLSQAPIALMMKKNVNSRRAGGRGGVFIKIASISGMAGHAAGIPYSIGTPGVIAIIKHTALEYGDKIFRAYTLALCNISTDATFHSITVTERKKVAMENSMNRCRNPREVATISASIASEDFAYATGNKIFTDGGMVMP